MPRYNGGFIGHDGLDAPDAPTIGTPSAGSTQADVAFTAGAAGTTATTEFVATTNDGIGATGTSSPITITGLTNNTSYTARVYAKNSHGTSAASEASASFTPLAEVISGLFQPTLWTGNGSTQTITTGIDLSNKGGLLWFKQRTSGTNEHNFLLDSERTAQYTLNTNTTGAEVNQTSYAPTFTSTGFSLYNWQYANDNNEDYVGWTFRKEPKFFDVVKITGTGGSRTINHSLGSVPGMIIGTRYDAAGENWHVYHRSLDGGNQPATHALRLNTTAAEMDESSYWNDTEPTSTQFTVGSNLNHDGGSFIFYLFAHNNNDGGFGPDSEDIIKCDTYTGNGSSTGPVITLGFEPQFIMLKRTDSSTNGNWYVFDNMRGIVTGGDDPYLYWNTDAAEVAGNALELTPTGFQLKTTSSGFNDNGGTYVYMAIRRGGMATPTLASDVFFVDETGSSESAGTQKTTGFPVDMQIVKLNNGSHTYIMDRLRGASSTTTSSGPYILGSSTTDEAGSTYTRKWDNNGYQISSALQNHTDSIYWNWARAKGYFDMVAYSGTGSGAQNVTHNLGVVPEMMWIKVRNDTDNWVVYHSAVGNTKRLMLNSSDGPSSANSIFFNNTTPTSSVFTAGSLINASKNYIAYLFATVAGVSKVGTYTGDGSAGKVIDCGFTNGAKFVLIKELNDSHNWYVYDTTRGISSGNDPYYFFNANQAENDQTDSIDPDSSGFAVNYANTNSNGDSYIFYAIATDPS